MDQSINLKSLFSTLLAVLVVGMCSLSAQAAGTVRSDASMAADGRLTVKMVAKNAVRVQYTNSEAVPKSIAEGLDELPDWLYVKHDEVKKSDVKVSIGADGQSLRVLDKRGRTVFTAIRH